MGVWTWGRPSLRLRRQIGERCSSAIKVNLAVSPVDMPKLSSSTILGHLTVLGITIADLSQCLTLEDEWAFIKKHHFNHIKVCHPDKGGDAGTFRSVNDSFNVLRELVSKNQINRFASDSSRATAREPDRRSAASQDEYAPWEWYEESGKVDFVPYIVSTRAPLPFACLGCIQRFVGRASKIRSFKVQQKDEKRTLRFRGQNRQRSYSNRFLERRRWQLFVVPAHGVLACARQDLAGLQRM
jgi:hypothetical protein